MLPLTKEEIEQLKTPAIKGGYTPRLVEQFREYIKDDAVINEVLDKIHYYRQQISDLFWRDLGLSAFIGEVNELIEVNEIDLSLDENLVVLKNNLRENMLEYIRLIKIKASEFNNLKHAEH